ncbi:MAG: NFACT RNA binding domain-containing protein [Bacteroidota bacterium]
MLISQDIDLKQFSTQIYYQDWAAYLDYLLRETYLERAQSFDKDTLYLQFAKKNFRRCIEIKIIDGYLLIFNSLKDLSSTNTKKGQLQFKELENAKISNVSAIDNDRLFYFNFSDSKRLWIKGFGKFSNVLLQEFDKDADAWHPTPTNIFRLGNKSDWEFHLHEIYPATASIITEQQLIERIEHWESKSLTAFREYIFQTQKHQKLRKTEQRLQHLNRILKDSISRLENLKLKRSNKEIGDLILAHAHSLRPGISKALVTDYYTQQRIWLKLNPDLSAADNAKKYYGKAKNEVIENQKLKENIETTKTSIKLLEAEYSKILEINNLKDLKPFKKEDVLKKTDTLPYKELTIQGYTLWVGKNAKSNDELLRLSSKNDLWLHAKDFTGSHVIIRKRGIEYPKEIVEIAAKLAATNSKAKTQSVVPVIFTLRKFVTKVKGGLPGQVNIQKESIIDVFL